MLRCFGLGLTPLLSIAFSVLTANAQSIPFVNAPRPLCVTDPYGVHFCSWYGSPVAFNSYFYYSPNGSYSNGYGYNSTFTSNGFYLGGVPAVASATTTEWTVQRTSVFPIGSYYPWMQYPEAYSSPWLPRIGRNSPPDLSNVQRRIAAGASISSPLIRQVNAIEVSNGNLEESFRTAGDRLLREDRPAEAYREYLKIQPAADDRGEVFFRQALALVAMERYSHAVAKFKQGLRVDPDLTRHESMVDEVYGEAGKSRIVGFLKQVETWTNADPRDPDRLFLIGVLLHFNEDHRADDYFAASQNGSARGPQHRASQ